MSDPSRSRPTASAAVYARLLVLYPSEMRGRHRSEMLQNFDDLERASSSTLALWLVLGRDLVTSVGSHWYRSILGPRTFARQSGIVATVLAVIIATAWLRHRGRVPFAVAFCCGYAVGWVSGWLQRRAVVVLALVGIAVSVSTDQRLLLTVCYACSLGWLASWIGKRRRDRSAI